MRACWAARTGANRLDSVKKTALRRVRRVCAASGGDADPPPDQSSWGTADRPPPGGGPPHCTFVTAGGFHDPSMIDGAVSFGQYMRSVRLNGPDGGAGSQFDSLSAPGESACT